MDNELEMVEKLPYVEPIVTTILSTQVIQGGCMASTESSCGAIPS